jgi:hypothetical protein
MKTILATTAATWLALVPGQAALAQTASQSIDSQTATPAPTDQSGDTAMDQAKKDRQKYLEQGFHMTQKLEFTVDAKTGTAKLVGKGSADLDSHLNFINPGGGAFLEVYFMSPGDPVFMQCEKLLNKNVPAGKMLSVFGHGSYEIGQEVGDPVVFKLGALTQCESTDPPKPPKR